MMDKAGMPAGLNTTGAEQANGVASDLRVGERGGGWDNSLTPNTRTTNPIQGKLTSKSHAHFQIDSWKLTLGYRVKRLLAA